MKPTIPLPIDIPTINIGGSSLNVLKHSTRSMQNRATSMQNAIDFFSRQNITLNSVFDPTIDSKVTS
jgi:hypothetical protein